MTLTTLARAAIVLAGTLLSSPLLAADGVLIVQRTSGDGKDQTIETQIEAQRMRTEILGPGGGLQVVIFDGAKQVMYMIDPSRKSYQEMTKADVERMSTQMSSMMAKMKEALEKMPPEQRAKMESMMKGGGMPGAAFGSTRTEFKKTGTSKAGKWTCDTYEGFVNGQKMVDACTVSPEVLGFKAADFAVTLQMAEFFKSMMPQGADSFFQIGRPDGQGGFHGIPVRQSTKLGARTMTSELVEATRKSFDAALFQVPAGFTKMSMPFGPGGPPPGPAGGGALPR